MTWLRIDDCLTDHPKIIGLSDGAFRLHISGLCYAARYLTDGFIPATYPKAISRQRFVPVLVAAGLWSKAKGGWKINDFLEYNPSKERVESERLMRKERAKAGGYAKAERAKALLQADSKQTTKQPHVSAPVPDPSDIYINQEDEDPTRTDPAVSALLAAMGEHERSQAHMEILSWKARGCSEFDLRAVARAVAKRRPDKPRSYVEAALRNRLADRESA